MPPLNGYFVGIAVVLTLAAGCGVPPELQPPKGAQVPVPSHVPQTSPAFPPGFTPRPTITATPRSTLSPFPQHTAVPCAGRPSPAQVIEIVKKETSIRPIKAIAMPVCAGTWQYTVLEVPGRETGTVESLQVLTKGEPVALILVAVGSDVCTVDVRRQAPTGILLASC